MKLKLKIYNNNVIHYKKNKTDLKTSKVHF